MSDGEVIAEAISWMPEGQWGEFVQHLRRIGGPDAHRLRRLADALDRCGSPTLAEEARAAADVVVHRV